MSYEMRLLPSSPRRRRRLGRAGLVGLACVALLLTVFVLLPSPKGAGKEVFTNEPVVVLKPAGHVPVTRQMRAGINATLARFLPEAVARRDLAASYDLVTQAFKGGLTRAQWARGDTPVYPYPVGTHSWIVDYSEPSDVTIDIFMQPAPGQRRRVGPLVMRTELIKRGGRWLVDSFESQAVFSAASAPRTTITAHPDFAPPASPQSASDKGTLGYAWFLVPAGLLGLSLLVPIAVALLGWRRDRRIRKEISTAYGFAARARG